MVLVSISFFLLVGMIFFPIIKEEILPDFGNYLETGAFVFSFLFWQVKKIMKISYQESHKN